MYTPANLPLVAWLKADANVYKDAGVTLASNNDTVQRWGDQTANGNYASIAAGTPKYITNVVNGLPVVRFDGASTMTLQNQAQFNLDKPCIFVVARIDTGNGGGTLTSKNDNVANASRRHLQLQGNFTYYAGNDGDNIIVANAPAGRAQLFASIARSNADHDLIVNSAKTTFGTVLDETSFNARPFELGGSFSSAGTFETLIGDLCEVIVGNGLSAAAIKNVLKYLNRKYGLFPGDTNIRDPLGGAV